MNTTSQTNKDKLFFRTALVITVLVIAAVVVLNKKILPPVSSVPSFTYMLPKLNACINGICTLLLLLSFYFIRRKKIEIHKLLNIITFLLSSVFLVSYVTYHYLVKEETKFPIDNPLRLLYLIILISHIILAAGILPLILLSFYYGLGNQIMKHRRIAKWTYPIWLYVTITGVIVYLMISPYYPIQ